jgi:hypothetical protein
MDRIWQIRLELHEDRNEVVVEEFQILKETESQFRYDRKNGAAPGRISKIAIDREPGILGGGKWFTSPEKALMAWQQHNQEEAEFHQGVAERCTEALNARAWE